MAVLVEGRTALGLLAFRDEPRADAPAAMRERRALGLRPVGLTGHNRRPDGAAAAALGLASVGVAMGSGTDVALETANAAILRDRVRGVPALVRLALATISNIRQNLALALGLKALFLETSIQGATVLVTLNTLRLLAVGPERAA